MTGDLLPRIISLIPVSNGQLCRTKLFEPDYEYTEHFVDLRSFDEVMIVRVDGSDIGRYVEFVTSVRRNCFLPLTLGGGVDSIEMADQLFELGADRVVVGSAALRRPRLLEELADRWGSQAVIGSVALRWAAHSLVAVDSREPNSGGVDALHMARLLQDSGAGEVLINSVDRDGSLRGLDLSAIRLLAPHIEVPYLVAGGVGNWGHLLEGIQDIGAAGVVTSNIYHLTPESIIAAKRYLAENGVAVRMPRGL